MDAVPKSLTSTSLFDVYLRLRPPPSNRRCSIGRFLDVDQPLSAEEPATHITIKPPTNDNRKRAVEKFAFTKVFDEDASQLDVLNGTAVLPMIEGVLGAEKKCGRDGLLATLGVTGSGKSHTILGSKSQRGLTQMALDALFKSIGQENIVNPVVNVAQLAAEDVSEAELISASGFLEAMYGLNNDTDSRMTSRAQTPMSMMVSNQPIVYTPRLPISTVGGGFVTRMTRNSVAKIRSYCSPIKETSTYSSIYPVMSPMPSSSSSRRNHQQMPTVASLPQSPSIDDLELPVADKDSCYAIVVSMYEVYNDRIFDLLNGSAASSKTTNAQRELRRRALLFKGTEYSPDRKVVCGLRKVVCGSFDEALLVLGAGLTERRVAGTGSNAVSSRSHGFFCVEVKKRSKVGLAGSWSSSTLTIVDLAGSERARTAKTAGATLAEAGKINESLMYLGQCMQMQSDNSDPSIAANRPALVPFRQCKLTELLFSNSFQQSSGCRQQRAAMIVTADPRGDFNATSQILRYSALAREVTVPRIPSVTSTILSGNTLAASTRSHTASSNSASDDDDVCRLHEELAILRLQLAEETRRRREAETSWAHAEERLEEIEADIREECWSSFEEKLLLERERWLATWEDERERVEDHLDRKLDLLVSGITLKATAADDESKVGSPAAVKIHVDESADADTVAEAVQQQHRRQQFEELERENQALRERMNNMQRDYAARTPSRKIKVLKARKWNMEFEADGEADDYDENRLLPRAAARDIDELQIN